MSKPKKKTKKAVKVEMGHCPKCSGRLNYDHGEVQDDFYRYDVDCPHCGWYGREDYRMDFTGFWDLKTDKEIPKTK
jgi:Zn-finger nucleic acid-binding protein